MNHAFDEELTGIDETVGYVPHVRNIPRQKKASRPRKPNQPVLRKQQEKLIAQEIHALADDKFQMTYKASRHEAVWLKQSLEQFFNQKWFDDVLRMVKGGKEASVYLCQGNDTTGYEHLAAKVYRPRMFRNLRNDGLYREGRSNIDESGREITNKGMLHAMRKRTGYGRELLHTSWLEYEFKTLTALHDAGADVPRPFASDSNAILMEYFGDDVMGAPTLNDIELDRAEAGKLYERVVHNIDLMLSLGVIRGDLSAFNILYWDDRIVLIDFPQAVHPDQNRSAFQIFQRDVTRVCSYFSYHGVKTNPSRLAAELWKKHNYRFIPLVDPKALSEDSDDERSIWESLKNS